MKVFVSFPWIMKMEVQIGVEVSSSQTLPEFKKRVLELFWEFMSSFSPIGQHGDATLIQLTDRHRIEISNEREFQQRIHDHCQLVAIFQHTN